MQDLSRLGGLWYTVGRMALTDYEKYIRTEELLALQKPVGDRTCRDELLFQVVHQAAELWMKLIADDLDRVVAAMNSDKPWAAMALLRRIGRVLRLITAQLDILDSLSPKNYMTIRTGLGRGSGQESPGFKTLLRLPGEIVWPAAAAMLERSGVSLRGIYEHPDENDAMFRLLEGLVDYDQLLQSWRYRHLMLVYRMIGIGTPSLKGKPSDLLAEGMKKRFFPELWSVRDEVFSDWTAEMKKSGRDDPYH